MTRRTTYRIVEGTRDAPKRIVVRVGAHNGANPYGRASLPGSLIGKIVEVVIPDIPIPDSAVGEGEPPLPRKRKVKQDAVVSTEVPAVVAETPERFGASVSDLI